MKRYWFCLTGLLLLLLASCSQQQRPELETQTPFSLCGLTLSKSWRGVTLVGSSAGVALSSDSALRLAPHVAVSSNGEALVVWLAFDGVNTYSVYASRYTRTPGQFFASWMPAVVIGTFKTIDSKRVSDGPKVAMDSSGNAVVVWEQVDVVNLTPLLRIYSRRFTPGGDWGLIRRLDNADRAGRPRIAMNAGGSAMVVWQQQFGSSVAVFSRRLNNGLWSAATQVGIAGSNAEVAIDAGGNAIAAWEQSGGIYASRFTAGAWSTPTGIDARRVGSGDTAIKVKLDMDATGHAIASWLQQSTIAQSYKIYTSRFDPGSGWAARILLQDGPDMKSGPQVAMDASRNVAVLWNQNLGNPIPAIYNINAHVLSSANMQIPSTNQSASLLENRNESANLPVIGMAAGGNGIALWTQSDGTTPSVYASHLTHQLAGFGCPETWSWGNKPILLESSNQSAFTPQIAMYPNDNAVAVWTENVGNGMNIYTNMYR